MGKGWAKNNYCTCAPDKIFGVDLSKVCYQHDVDYLKKKNKPSRFIADKKFFFAVLNEFTKRKKNKIGFIVAIIYFLMVRAFGWIYWKK